MALPIMFLHKYSFKLHQHTKKFAIMVFIGEPHRNVTYSQVIWKQSGNHQFRGYYEANAVIKTEQEPCMDHYFNHLQAHIILLP
jgi:hypothetical protein